MSDLILEKLELMEYQEGAKVYQMLEVLYRKDSKNYYLRKYLVQKLEGQCEKLILRERQ